MDECAGQPTGCVRLLCALRRWAGPLRCVVLALAACLFAASAFGQTATEITTIKFVSKPTGGPSDAPNTVYIIDDKIEVEVVYDEPLLPEIGSPSLEINLGNAPNARTAPCVLGSRPNVLLCTYVVREGDAADSIRVGTGEKLSGGELPDRIYNQPVPHAHYVDGIRLAISDITISGARAGFAATGFAATDVIEVTLTFAPGGCGGDLLVLQCDMPPWRPIFGVALVLDNAERQMRHYEDNYNRTMTFRYDVVAGDVAEPLRLKLSDADRLLDNNGNQGLRLDQSVNDLIADGAIRRVDTQGPRISDIRILNNAATFLETASSPTSVTPLEKQIVQFRVDFDEKVSVTDAHLLVEVGDATRPADCVLTSMPTDFVTCHLRIVDGWYDANGLATPANPLVFKTIEDDLDNAFVRTFAAQQFPDHKVDAVRPTLKRVSVSVPTEFEVKAGNNIVVTLEYSDDVKAEPVEAQARAPGRPAVPAGPAVKLAIGGTLRDPAYATSHRKFVEFRYSLIEDDVTGYIAGADNTRRVTVESITPTGITDIAGNPVRDTGVPSHSAGILELPPSGITDTKSPTVDRTTLIAPPSGRIGIDGGSIDVDVVFSESVTLSGAQVKVEIGSQKDHLLLSPLTHSASSASSARHRFSATVADLTTALRNAAPNAPPLHGDVRAVEIVLDETNDSVLDGANLGWINQLGDPRHAPSIPLRGQRGSAFVDTERPKIESVKLLSSPAPTGVRKDGARFYGKGDRIHIEVAMSEEVIAAWQRWFSSQITLNVTGADGRACGTPDSIIPTCPSANVVSSRRGKTLVFEYEVQPTHVDRDGIGLKDITYPGQISDLAGNTCTIPPPPPTFPAQPSTWPCDYTPASWASTITALHPVDGTIFGDQRPEDQRTEDPTETPPEDEADTTTTPPVTIASVTKQGDPRAGQHYGSGESITLVVNFEQPVDVSAAPTLVVNVGSATKRVPCTGIGTGLRSIRCVVPVAAGDEDTDGISLAELSGGTIQANGQDVSRTLPAISGGGPRVDARRPTVANVSFASRGPYVLGASVDVTVAFSESVSWQGTSPTLSILVGGANRAAELRSPSENRVAQEFVFRYVVQASDNDPDGISIAANSLGRAGGVRDGAGNALLPTHRAVAGGNAQRVDTQGPTVADIDLGNGRVYLAGDTITATVRFSEPVRAATNSTLTLAIGSVPHPATYASGNNTPTLTFTYSVRPGDGGTVSVPHAALVGITDTVGNPIAANAAEVFAGHVVDTAGPAVTAPPTIASRPASGDTYARGETIRIAVTFDDAVNVTGVPAPRMHLTVGSERREAAYAGGSGSTTLSFHYVVQVNDLDEDGVSIGANAFVTSGATIRDRNGVDARLGHGAVPDRPEHKVDAVAPTITGIEITSRPVIGDAYTVDENVVVTVTFDEDIAVSGAPILALTVGTELREAPCAQDKADTLACRYAVVIGDVDRDGVAVAAGTLAGGTVTDTPGNPAARSHGALADDPNHKVLPVPTLAEAIPDMSLVAGGVEETVALDEVFAGSRLVFEASSTDPAVAEAVVSGSALTVHPGMEGTATVTVTASNPAGSLSTDFSVSVATDPVEKAVLNDALAAIGRGMLSSTANIIGSRFSLDPSTARMALGGRRPGSTLSPQMQQLALRDDPHAAFGARGGSMAEPRHHAGIGGHGMTAGGLLAGSAFNMPLRGSAPGPSFAIWGGGDLSSFTGEPMSGAYDGTAIAGHLGVDARGAGWLAGVSVSRSSAEADYDFASEMTGSGTLKTGVTALHPYARLEVGADAELWAIGGFGAGTADLTRSHVAEAHSSNLSMAMAIGGLRYALPLEFRGSEFSLRGDAGFLVLDTGTGELAVDALSASVSRLRLGVEAAWEGRSATPFVEVSGRLDGGDGQTGSGLELAGGVRIRSPESGFGLEAKGRLLALHSGEGYGEAGFGVIASFEPGTAGRGLVLRLSPHWGGSPDATDLFWDEAGGFGRAGQHGLRHDRTWGLDAELGYGFSLRSIPGLMTPFGQADVANEADQRIRLGIRYGLARGLLRSTRFEVAVERVDGERHQSRETRVLARGQANF